MESHAEPRRLKKFLIPGAILLVFALYLAVRDAANERGWSGYVCLMRDGATCQAVITRSEIDRNCLAEYSYTVGGRSYLGIGADCSTRPGQQVTITYLVDDPSHSCIGRPGERLANDVASYFFGGLSFPSLQ